MSVDAHKTTAVIRAEPDGYDMDKPALMGRQAAGHGFLRAAVAARGDQPIYGLAPHAGLANGFKSIVESLDPAARFEWIPSDQLGRIRDVGVLYLADITVASHARVRQRLGVNSFSLCGVTHTTASQGAMNEIAGLLREPVMPWDALVCTSTSVVETVHRVFEAEADYLRWRFGPAAQPVRPQLPIIPLGVHCDDFVFTDDQRRDARDALGLAPDEVVGLFVGRLVFHAKAHPYAMMRGFQAAAERTGQRLALVLCGWSPNDAIANLFRTGAAQFCPDVRVLFVEGRDPPKRAQAWAAADLFVSLSDNIQETFGLTPIEAMAAGLPQIVSDWNGYRDTVRQGVDGIRVRTSAPAPGLGQALARALESRAYNYDRYCWAAAASTAVDLAELTDAIVGLVRNPERRRELGEAARRRAREVFDWSVVYRQYQALWADLNARRASARDDEALARLIASAPPSASAGLDPFHAFGHYATDHITGATRLAVAPGADAAQLRSILTHGLFSELSVPSGLPAALYALVAQDPLSIEAAAARLKVNLPTAARAAGVLMKIGVVKKEEDN